MSQFASVITAAGIALQQRALAGVALIFTRIALGDGEISGNPEDQLSLANEKQASNIAEISIVSGSARLRADFTNQGLGEGYSIRELGIFAEDIDNPGQEVLYAYGNAGEAADYMPADSGGDVTTLLQEVVVGVGSAPYVTALIDQTAVYVTGEQWNGHVGVGGTDQHPAATTTTAGFMSSADKSKLNTHVGAGGSSQHPFATASTSGFMSSGDKAIFDAHMGQGGTTRHPVATTSVAGFLSATDKTKLDGIASGAEVNQNAFSTVKVGSTNIVADAKTDTLELAGGTYITLTPNASLDKLTIEAQNIAPSSHIGSTGAAHGVATSAVAGFMSASDKSRLDLLCPGWLVQLKHNTNLTDIDGWNGSSVTSVVVARIPSLNGELCFFSPDAEESQTWLFKQRITAATAGTLSIPVIANDDRIWLGTKRLSTDTLIDGGYFDTGDGYDRILSVALPAAGDYMVYLVMNNTGGNDCHTVIAEWYGSNITWKAFS